MVSERRQRRDQRKRRRLENQHAVWVQKKQRLAEARTAAERIAAEFDLLRLAADRLNPAARDQVLFEVGEVIRRKRMTLGDFTLPTSHGTSRAGSGFSVPRRRAGAREASLTTTTGSKP